MFLFAFDLHTANPENFPLKPEVFNISVSLLSFVIRSCTEIHSTKQDGHKNTFSNTFSQNSSCIINNQCYWLAYWLTLALSLFTSICVSLLSTTIKCNLVLVWFCYSFIVTGRSWIISYWYYCEIVEHQNQTYLWFHGSPSYSCLTVI